VHDFYLREYICRGIQRVITGVRLFSNGDVLPFTWLLKWTLKCVKAQIHFAPKAPPGTARRKCIHFCVRWFSEVSHFRIFWQGGVNFTLFGLVGLEKTRFFIARVGQWIWFFGSACGGCCRGRGPWCRFLNPLLTVCCVFAQTFHEKSHQIRQTLRGPCSKGKSVRAKKINGLLVTVLHLQIFAILCSRGCGVALWSSWSL